MTLKKWCILVISIIFLLTLSVIIYSKTKFIHIDYDDFIKKSQYNYIGSKLSNNSTMKMNYEEDLKLDDFFIDEQVETLEDLKNLSDYILIVSNEKKPLFLGNSIINTCNVIKVIKGNNIKESDEIKIYDLVFNWDSLSTIYIGGNTPLLIGDEYVVFLKKTENGSIKNAYVFSSVNYGRVSILKERKVLDNYEYGSLNLDEIMQYDYVFSKGTEKEKQKYKKMVKEIRNDVYKLNYGEKK